MKESIKKLGDKLKHAWKYSINTWIFRCFVIAFVLELVLEMLGRRSFIAGFEFMLNSPFVYIYNVSIIFFTLLFALFLRKRLFGIIVISVIWLICGTVNFVVLGYRVTPFAAIDFVMAKDVLGMIDVYLTKWQQVLVLILLIAVIAGIVYLFIRSPKFKGSRRVKGTMLLCVLAWIGVIYLTRFAVSHNIISDDFANLGMAYKDYGFAYCFTNSIIDNGIEYPENYDKATMLGIKSELDKMPSIGEMCTPNIIYIQLESFFDPKTVKGLKMSADPVPNFTALKEQYPSGYLTVPALGAGTANSEYEVITSMKSSSFGAGEYPYKTTINKEPVEGIASVLKKQGYTAFAIHNNTATFYDRNKVYEQMGFDNFISLEYMYDIQETATGWAKDYSLADDIMRCIESTEGKDLVYTISVQGHGRYPTEVGMCEDHIQIEYENKDIEPQFYYYVNQLFEMDEMIGDLISRLDASGEEYVLVLYGDHLPSLDLTDESLTQGNIFQTEYIIVNNVDLKLPDEDIDTNELTPRILRNLRIPMSYAQKANLYYKDDEERKEKLNLIAYDMLFGSRFMYNGRRVVPENTIQMGLLPISISEVKNVNDHVVVTGENFNQFSVVYVDGEAKDTTYVDANTLLLEDVLLDVGDEVEVVQVTDSHHILSSTAVFNYFEK